MLGRTADQLYWMARYMERAENMARLLDVNFRMALMPQRPDEKASVWLSALQVAGVDEARPEGAEPPTADDVIWQLALDPDCSTSILSSLQAARENARALRGSISSEVWESLNTTWIEARGTTLDALKARGVRNFFDWVKDRSHLFRGVTDGTMLKDAARGFIDLGTFLERADNTARLLDSKYHILLPDSEDVGGAVDYYQWGSVLRSVSAFRAYIKVFNSVITPFRVAELLVMRHNMPRSLHACLDRITEVLEELTAGRPTEGQRVAGSIHAGLHYGRMEDVFRQGLHQFLTEFIDKNTALGTQIERDFWMIK